MVDDELYRLAAEIGEALKARGLMLATAESCTGGWVGEAVTAVPGSSHWYERGFITYTDRSKQEMLGVSAQTLTRYGAVSEAVVREMVAGALERSHAQVALAISGIAGPGGGTPDKPVGMVCLAWGAKDSAIVAETHRFDGDRRKVRRQAVEAALRGVLAHLR
jgi:nicotinamide-nucleotide amidase